MTNPKHTKLETSIGSPLISALFGLERLKAEASLIRLL